MIRPLLPRYAWLALCLLAVPLLAACDNKPAPEQALISENGHSDVEGVKLAVGTPAADFTLTNMDSDPVTLSSFRGNSSVMLVFYRGYWCPFCISHLEDIQSLFPHLDEYNVQLIVISPEDAEDQQKTAKRLDQTGLFLSDKDMKVIDLYGIRRDKNLPHPAVILIDEQGIVQWFYVGEDYKQRPSASQLEQVIERIAEG